MMGSGTRVAGLALFVSIAGFAVATTVPAQADDGAPGVARVHLLDGDVDIKRADATDPVAAAVNAPLNVGDYVSTHDGSRSEIELGDRTALRVASDSQLRFTRLDADATTLQLAAGTIDARLFDGVGTHPEIDVPGATITPQRSGSYRVTVDGDGNARVTVRSGAALVATNGDSISIGSGTTLRIDGSNGDGARFERVDTLASDGFDAWNVQRDDAARDVPSYAYLDNRYVGADDLDRYGSWHDVSGYGNVWHPSYANDWAPYTDGRFAWEPYYGWTWVSAEPWGWAPYHYGRWFDAPGVGWCWSPGRAQAVAYEPALVSFFSFGGAGLSLGFGNIGWVPLAPNEAFHPWWGRGFGYGDGYRGDRGNRTVVNNTTNVTNITNITNVTNIANYQNYSAPGGIVALRRENFIAGRFDRRVSVTRETLRDQHPTAIRGIVPAVPTTGNLAYGGRAIARPQPLAPSFAHFTPPVTRIASFDAQRDGVRTIAIKQYPERSETFKHEAPVARQTSEPVDRIGTSAMRAPARAEQRSAPVTLAPTRTATSHAPSSVWDRFGSSDSTHRVVAPRSTTGAPRETTIAPRDTTVAPRPTYVAPPETSVAPRARTSDPWSRFSSGSVERTVDRAPSIRPHVNAPEGPSLSSEAPHRTMTQATHLPSDTPHRTNEPRQAPEAPRRAYEAPRPAEVPHRTYDAPSHRTYASPRTYEGVPSSARAEPRARPASVDPAPAARPSEVHVTEHKPGDASPVRPHRP